MKSSRIHPTAIVSKHAEIDRTVEIGPYAIIEDGAVIGKNVKIYARAYISGGTEIGEGTEVHMGAVLGHIPQDLAFEGKKTYLRIGKKNIIREYVTVHRGTKEGTATEIGNENFLMAFSHVGHNCVLGDKVILGVVEVFKKNLRERDIIARYGGDEFSVILPDTDLEEAWEIAEGIRLEVSGLDVLKKAAGSITQVTTSQGVAAFPKNADSIETLREAADQALYTAKEEGRNRVSRAR